MNAEDLILELFDLGISMAHQLDSGTTRDLLLELVDKATEAAEEHTSETLNPNSVEEEEEI